MKCYSRAAGRLLDTIESLRRNLEESIDHAHKGWTQRGGMAQRAESAEAENARLREALKPFANIADRYYEKGAGDFISPTFSVGTFRDAQQALTGGGK